MCGPWWDHCLSQPCCARVWGCVPFDTTRGHGGFSCCSPHPKSPWVWGLRGAPCPVPPPSDGINAASPSCLITAGCNHPGGKHGNPWAGKCSVIAVISLIRRRYPFPSPCGEGGPGRAALRRADGGGRQVELRARPRREPGPARLGSALAGSDRFCPALPGSAWLGLALPGPVLPALALPCPAWPCQARPSSPLLPIAALPLREGSISAQRKL